VVILLGKGREEKEAGMAVAMAMAVVAATVDEVMPAGRALASMTNVTFSASNAKSMSIMQIGA
jgi:hypothetical protein